METSEALQNLSQLTCSLVAPHVKTCQYLEKGEESEKEHAVAYTENTYDWSISYDRASQSWKTSQGILFPLEATAHQLETYSETWPSAGMMRNGIVSQLPNSARLMRGCGYSLLPTPAARDYRDLSSTGKSYAAQRLRHQPSLATEAYLAEVDGSIANAYEWAMGFPAEWCERSSKPAETPSSPKLQSGSDAE